MSVSKINFNEDNEALIVVDPISEIDKKEFKKYLDVDSPFFLRTEFENDKAFTLFYSFENRITLKQLLAQEFNKEEALSLLKSLTEVFMVVEKHDLNPDHVLLGINSVFYDEANRQISCVYVPVKEGVLPARPLRLFLKEMLVNMLYAQDADMTWLGNVIRYISSNRSLDYRKFYAFLESQEKVSNISSAPIDVPETKTVMPEKEVAVPQSVNLQDDIQKTFEAVSSDTKAVKDDLDGFGDIKATLESIPAAESVDVLKEEISLAFGDHTEESAPVDIPEIPVAKPAPIEVEDPMDDDAKACLLRRSSQEIYMVEPREMYIGKSAGNDICISGNPAVSRVHAVLCYRDGKYWIRDHESTNHTFVNGILVMDDQEKELKAGDRILLGNEELIFKN